MTEQLTLMTGEPSQCPPLPEISGATSPPAQARCISDSSASSDVSPLRAERGPVLRIENHTKQSARLGLQQARAALSEANRRVAEREAQRLAQREEQLLQLSDAARKLALVASAPQQPRLPLSSESPPEASRAAA